MVNLVIFGGILAWYSGKIFAIFAISASLYIIWILLFLKRREDLDYKMFTQNSQEQSKTIELVSGMQEIKLHNAERRKRWGWEKLQAKIFKVRVKGLALEQVESVGGNFINELKNILISVFSAQLVIDGQITLGMMMSISYIIGQLNAPLSQMINFIHTYQDAKIALERLSEIHNKDNEENPESIKHEENMHKHDMVLKNVSFRYRGETELVLDDISLTIPAGKTTAIVGASGSGKTTLMKLLLKFYEPTKGDIKLGNTSLSKISHRLWRSISGVVMQDGFIFNESIAQNIAVGDEK
jgi:ATP-binding cassette, subfamily B, bacterial